MDTWVTFLAAAKNIYTSLALGAKLNPQSQQWFGGKQDERRNDDLLQYIYEARNDSEHGLGRIAERVPGSLSINPRYSKENPTGRLRLSNFVMQNGEISFDLPEGHGAVVERVPAHVKLATVQGRGRQYPPPTKHLGRQLIDTSPTAVAAIALAYLERLVDDARARA